MDLLCHTNAEPQQFIEECVSCLKHHRGSILTVTNTWHNCFWLARFFSSSNTSMFSYGACNRARWKLRRAEWHRSQVHRWNKTKAQTRVCCNHVANRTLPKMYVVYKCCDIFTWGWHCLCIDLVQCGAYIGWFYITVEPWITNANGGTHLALKRSWSLKFVCVLVYVPFI